MDHTDGLETGYELGVGLINPNLAVLVEYNPETGDVRPSVQFRWPGR